MLAPTVLDSISTPGQRFAVFADLSHTVAIGTHGPRIVEVTHRIHREEFLNLMSWKTGYDFGASRYLPSGLSFLPGIPFWAATNRGGLTRTVLIYLTLAS